MHVDFYLIVTLFTDPFPPCILPGVCAFRSGTDAATAIRASCRGELMITIRNLEFAFQSSAESLESYSFQHFPGHQEKVKFSSNSSTCTVKRSNVPKPDAKLAKPERIRTCTLEGYRDKALDAFRRGVENTVKDCEGILNRAITMALLDSGSVSVLEQSESSSAADLEAKLLCTAGNIHQNSKACPDRCVLKATYCHSILHSIFYMLSDLMFYHL